MGHEGGQEWQGLEQGAQGGWRSGLVSEDGSLANNREH